MDTVIINENENVSSENIVTALKNVFDPEIDFSVYDIGLIYEIKIQQNNIDVIMTLTTINCPEAQAMPEMVKAAIEEIYPQMDINVEVTFEPEWTVENMADEVKLKLGLL